MRIPLFSRIFWAEKAAKAKLTRRCHQMQANLHANQCLAFDNDSMSTFPQKRFQCSANLWVCTALKSLKSDYNVQGVTKYKHWLRPWFTPHSELLLGIYQRPVSVLCAENGISAANRTVRIPLKNVGETWMHAKVSNPIFFTLTGSVSALYFCLPWLQTSEANLQCAVIKKKVLLCGGNGVK